MRDRLLLVVLLTSLVVAVDRSKFKSCSQSGFCKRCRAVEAGVSTYQVRELLLSLLLLRTFVI